jgi:hypothetical protein
MLQGQTAKRRSGAVGQAYGKGRVQNVSEIEDRELIVDGSLNKDKDIDGPVAPGTAIWTLLGNDTLNLTQDADHRIGTKSLEFDKVNGAANTKNAGMSRTDAGLDLSRFLTEGVLLMGIKMSALTDVASVTLRLGSNSSDYMQWTWNDADMVGAVWNDLIAFIDEGTVVGNGWDPANVDYVSFFVTFDAETDALADILVDYVMAAARPPKGALYNGVNLASVTAATDGAAVRTGRMEKKMANVAVSGNTGAVTVTIEHSPDGSAWYELDSKTYTAVNEVDSWSYDSHFPFMRITTSVHANATVKGTITGRYI